MYLNLIQIAESLGVSERVIEGWVREDGMPHTADRGRLLFDRDQVAEWAAERGLAARAGFLAPETSGLASNIHLGALLRNGGIWRDVAATQAPAIFERVVTAMPGATAPVRKLIGQRVRAEGGVTMAPIGGGFALPHPSTRVTLGRDSGLVALILLGDVISSAEPDGLSMSKLLFFIAPSPRAHLDMIARLSRLLSRGELGALIDRGAGDDEILGVFDAFDAEFGVQAGRGAGL